MATAASINNKIVSYLDQLNISQKKAVLSVAKALAEAVHEPDVWEDMTFVDEMATRVTDLEKGKTKGHTWDEVKKETRKAVKSAKTK